MIFLDSFIRFFYFKRPELTHSIEIGCVIVEIDYILEHLKDWASPKHVSGLEVSNFYGFVPYFLFQPFFLVNLLRRSSFCSHWNWERYWLWPLHKFPIYFHFIFISLNSFHFFFQVEKTFLSLLDTPLIVKDPYGVVLIISPWNYPINLLFMPLIPAIAAGTVELLSLLFFCQLHTRNVFILCVIFSHNYSFYSTGNTVILKPSELAPNTTSLISELITKYFDPVSWQDNFISLICSL